MNSKFSRVRTALGLLLVLAVVAVIVAAGILPRIRERKLLRQQTEYSAEPVVVVSRPNRSNPAEEVVLPGNMQAFIDSPIYARTNGYLKAWYHDIGAHVKKGEPLALIESPEVDQQLAQAKEDLSTAQANLKLAQITAVRYTDLFKTDSVAKQEVDNAVQDAAAKAAIVKSAQANVARLQQMVDFERIYAPFDGVITARNTDIGQLIDSGSSGGPGRELFHIATVDKLRVFTNVPQIYAHAARPGILADLTVPDLPNRRFQGKLVRTADAMDPNTRTLLVEVDVNNSSGLLFPGAYTEVHFKIHSNGSTLIIPSTSLVFRSEGLRVPVVKNNRVALLPVQVGRDFGRTIEVLAGLSDDALVILNPPDSLVNGERVRVVPAKETKEVEE
ncbi:MAG: efflux RND transporter periplasmic adaptor subunit [Acidobacteriaceae bacterium]|nr:efflux RND transporter periplasmic adaptor subunit [Acidobacteriaceae bacterium]MBV9498851.1 efflux RND transporter periplasmic adaptor subunit [Acidobacteriaceae bacterium]